MQHERRERDGWEESERRARGENELQMLAPSSDPQLIRTHAHALIKTIPPPSVVSAAVKNKI